MQKPLALSIAVCVCLTGCQVFEKSETWENVTQVRVGDSIRDPDPSASYCAKLHRVLLEQGVEHLVVTYQFHYYNHQYEEAVETRTAIVYRDNVTPSYPWWLKDDRTATPVWLPNGDLSSQISFYIHRPAEVIEQKAYPAHGGSGKTSVSMFRQPTVKPRSEVAEYPLQKQQHAVTKIARVEAKQAPAKPLVPFRTTTKLVVNTPPTKRAPITKIQHPANFAMVKPKPAHGQLPPPVANGHFEASLSPSLEKLFRIRNGTHYDRTSAMDRRKMAQLKHSVMGREVSEADVRRHGADGFESRLR